LGRLLITEPEFKFHTSEGPVVAQLPGFLLKLANASGVFIPASKNGWARRRNCPRW
jgi:hypothetical protein